MPHDASNDCTLKNLTEYYHTLEVNACICMQLQNSFMFYLRQSKRKLYKGPLLTLSMQQMKRYSATETGHMHPCNLPPHMGIALSFTLR